jgi:hypothetical protein
VWNIARAGTAQWDDPEGNMFWYPSSIPPEGAPFMYDESVVITMANDTTKTWFSAFDGSDDEVSLIAQSHLTTASFPTYEYAHGLWSSGDTSVVGEIEYYLPIHGDTCVLIERIKICNNRDQTITIHVGEVMDWDIPDGSPDGNANNCGKDEDLEMVYQYGEEYGEDPTDYYGGSAFCNPIVGAIVLKNSQWIYPNEGYDPAKLGHILATHTGFVATVDSVQDLNSVYVVDKNVVLAEDACVVYCKVKTSSIEGLQDLKDLIAKGKQWILDHELDCPGCEPPECPDEFKVGDADQSGAIDIDDVVYLIAYIFSGGPAPVPCSVTSGDADCTNGVDIDDVVYLIAYIFSGGPAPCTCIEWMALYGPPTAPAGCEFGK